jgi:hypothetical protein
MAVPPSAGLWALYPGWSRVLDPCAAAPASPAGTHRPLLSAADNDTPGKSPYRRN